MITEAGIEFCVVKEYPDGYKFCMAKFMYEEDARNWKRSRKKNENVVWKIYERRGKTAWTEMG